MIGVEDAPRARDVELVLRGPLPGNLEEPVEIRARHDVLGGALRHLPQAPPLLEGRVADEGRHAGSLDALAELVHLDPAVLLAELLLYRPQLLPQVVLALFAIELLADVALYLLADLHDLELVRNELVDESEPLHGIDDLEHLLFVGDLHRQIRGEHVREPAGAADPRDDVLDLFGIAFRRLGYGNEGGDDVAHERLRAVVAPVGLGDDRDPRPHERRLVGEALDLDPGEPLPDDAHVPVRKTRHLLYEERAPLPVEVRRTRALHLLVDLREHADDLRSGERLVDDPYQVRVGENERDEHVREHDRVVDRHDRELVRNLPQQLASLGYLVDFATHVENAPRRRFFNRSSRA